MKPLNAWIGLVLSLLIPTVNAELSEQERKTLKILTEQISKTRSDKTVGFELIKEGETLTVNVGEQSYFLPYEEGLPAVSKAIYQSYPCINQIASEKWGNLSLICQSFKGTFDDQLTFPPDYLSYFEELNGETDTFTGKGDKLAIVVHDPHFALDGQRALFLGLQKIIAQNQLNKHNAVFLMEGLDSTDTLNSLLDKLSEKFEHNKNAFYWMFNHHQINAPLLVNLVDQLDIPIQGIEDIKLYLENKYDPNHNAILRTAVAIQALMAKRQGKTLDVEETKRFLESQLPEFYSKARQRSEVMATHVSDFIKSHNNQYSFIFIGNFHEKEILAKLKEDQTSYIVMKPLQSPSFVGDVEPYEMVEKQDNYLKRIRPNFKTLVSNKSLLNIIREFSSQDFGKGLPQSPKEGSQTQRQQDVTAELKRFNGVFVNIIKKVTQFHLEKLCDIYSLIKKAA
ncbi:MAG: hypothetical protein DRR19_07940 [Candidatus Parabeggiatoa sp. nov. 1]|nr:MAG: hypothetical protein DRR19_07940 [Gammaproteobacteria bacterium]